MAYGSPLEAVLKQDRLIVLSGLLGLSSLMWGYMVYLTQGMMNMDQGMELTMPTMPVWAGFDLVFIFAMWAVMMMAMMLPPASPMILLFATLNRRRREQHDPFVPTSVFLLGYLAVWIGFSALAAIVQWGLHVTSLLSPTMMSANPIIGGALLLVAGIFQWTPLKHACLAHCRSPLGFLMTNWREGRGGAFSMGLRHGGYCVGCCWLLMSLLLVTGVMNLLWMALMATFVLVEKVSPAGHWVSRAAGLLFVGWGIWMVAGA